MTLLVCTFIFILARYIIFRPYKEIVCLKRDRVFIIILPKLQDFLPMRSLKDMV